MSTWGIPNPLQPWVLQNRAPIGLGNTAGHVNHGGFWSQDVGSSGVDIGECWWSSLVCITPDMVAEGTGYLISDGAGGAHALLWGLSLQSTGFSCEGNIWPRAATTGSALSYQSQLSDGIQVGEWGVLTFGYENTANNFMWQYWNGVPIGVQQGPAVSRFSYNDVGVGPLYVFGSDHQMLAAKLAWITGWDRNKWANGSPYVAGYAWVPSMRPQLVRPNASNVPIPADFVADYTKPNSVVLDLNEMASAGTGAAFRGQPYHHGRLEFGSPTLAPQVWGPEQVPFWSLDPTCPMYRLGPIPHGKVSAAQTLPTDQSYLLIDDFSNRRSTFADTTTPSINPRAMEPSLGSTVGGSLSSQAWQTAPFVFNGTGVFAWGTIFGYGFFSGNTISPAWVDTAQANGGVQIRQPTSCIAGRISFNQCGPGAVFRLQDKDNYHAVVSLSDNNAIYRKVTAGVAVDSSPFALPASWTGIRATFSGTAINVYATTSSITTPNADWGSSLFNTTSSSFQSATKCGMLAIGGLARFSQFAAW